MLKRVVLIAVGIVAFALVFTIISRPGGYAAPLQAPGYSGYFNAVGNSMAAVDEVQSRQALAYDAAGVGGGAPANPPSAALAPDGLTTDNYQSGNNAGENRLVLKNADLTIVVKDPAGKMKAMASLAEGLGGYVVSSSLGETYLADGTKVPEGSVVMRIPEEKLDDVLSQIKADAVEVRNENRTGQDVTKEYTDLGSQLKNLEATEQQLNIILQKTEKAEDVLAVFNQLTQIRGQIEVTKGQMKYYEQAAALSSVSVRLLAERANQPIEFAGWQPQGQARDAVQALVNFFQNFVSFLIWLVIFFIPAAAVVLLLLFLAWRLGRWLWFRFFARKSPQASE